MSFVRHFPVFLSVKHGKTTNFEAHPSFETPFLPPTKINNLVGGFFSLPFSLVGVWCSSPKTISELHLCVWCNYLMNDTQQTSPQGVLQTDSNFWWTSFPIFFSDHFSFPEVSEKQFTGKHKKPHILFREIDHASLVRLTSQNGSNAWRFPFFACRIAMG